LDSVLASVVHHQGYLSFSLQFHSSFLNVVFFLGSSTMSLSKSEKQSSNLKPDHSNYVTREELREFDLNNQLAKLALPLAQAWRDNHPNAQPGSEEDLDECVLAVAIEMAVAGEAVGGPMGALIAAGGGVAAASVACRRVL
jgi:hypothetical protein